MAEAIVVESDTVFNMLVDTTGIDRILLSANEEDVEKNFVSADSNGFPVFRDKISKAITKDGITIQFKNGNKDRRTNRDAHPKWLVEDTSVIVGSMQERLQAMQDKIGNLKTEQAHKILANIRKLLFTLRQISVS